MKFLATVTETLSRNIEIEAHSELEAEDIIQEMYNNEEIVLMPSDCCEVEFYVSPLKQEAPSIR